jgi:hypothetical protein
MESIPITAILAGMAAAIAVLGGIAGALAIRWLDERDRRKDDQSPPPPPSGQRPTYSRGVAPAHPVAHHGPPSRDTRLNLLARDWAQPRRPM